jgi:hypothetical protein
MPVTPDTVKETQKAIAGIYQQLEEPEVTELFSDDGWKQFDLAEKLQNRDQDRELVSTE